MSSFLRADGTSKKSHFIRRLGNEPMLEGVLSDGFNKTDAESCFQKAFFVLVKAVGLQNLHLVAGGTQVKFLVPPGP